MRLSGNLRNGFYGQFGVSTGSTQGSAVYHPDPHTYILAEGKRYTSQIGNSSRIPNLASEIGALCHIFRNIDVFSAFPEAALRFGCYLGKSTENVNILKNRTLIPSFFACSPMIASLGPP